MRVAVLTWPRACAQRRAAAAACTGDCDGDGAVTVDELLVGVNIALGNAPVSACPSFDSNGDGSVTIDEILTAVNNALERLSADADADGDTDAATHADGRTRARPRRR